MKFAWASGFSAISVLFFLAGTKNVKASDTNCGTNSKIHNFTYGKRVPADRLIYEDNIDYKSKWMGIISVDVSYPSRGTNQQGVITYIEVYDLRSDGTGGCVYIKNGGVGQNHVTLHFKSQRNHAMEFLVKVYGQ